MQSRKFLKCTKSTLASAVTAVFLPALALGFSVQASAGSLTTANEDVTLSGGVSAGYFYSTNTGSDNADNFVVNEFLIDLSAEAKPGGVGFSAGFGNLALLTVLDGNGDGADTTSSLRYAVMSYMPVSKLTISAGVLATNVGYELGNTMDNSNITLGAIWNAEPLFYPGARVNYEVSDNAAVYAEVSNPNAFGVGVIGSAGSVSYALNYFDQDEGNNTFDIVASTEVAGMPVGINFDYIAMDTGIAGFDDSGMGLAVFVAPKIGKIDLPIRVEYISDGDSGIYGFDSGYTFTITPTLNVAKNAFVRAEFSMVSADVKMFKDKDGVDEDTKMSGAFQMGYRF